MLNIHAFMSNLAVQRSIFHSEADFQHAFAWQLQQWFPEAKIRLELPVNIDKWIYVDIWSQIEGTQLYIELKYKSANLQITHSDESFHLKNHGAEDIGRYDFLKDIYRLEQIVNHSDNAIGFAILLTNEPKYWRKGRSTTIDSAFRVHDNRTLTGTLQWGDNAGIGTTRNRTDPIVLKKAYPIKWKSYSALSTPKYGEFRYVALEI